MGWYVFLAYFGTGLFLHEPLRQNPLVPET